MLFQFNLKFIFIKVILFFLLIFQFKVFASSKLDCKEKAFYIREVISEAKDVDLTKAKSKAEEKGRIFRFHQIRIIVILLVLLNVVHQHVQWFEKVELHW